MKNPLEDPELLGMLSPAQIADLRKQLEKLAQMHGEATKRGLCPGETLAEQRNYFLAMRDFFGYLQTYRGRERFERFQSVLPQLNDTEYWELIRQVWTMLETIMPHDHLWLDLLQSTRPNRESLMSTEEHAALAAMPDELKIWRGCGNDAGERGISWTTEKKKAEFFANYACGSRREFLTGAAGTRPTVVSAVCSKEDVLAYFTERDESEILVDPSKVRSVKATRIKSQN